MYLLIFFSSMSTFIFSLLAFHFGPTSLPLCIYLVSSLSSPISTFTTLFLFFLYSSTFPTSYLPISLLPTPCSSFLLCLSRSKTCITSIMAVPHRQEPSEPHSCPSREKGRFTCNVPPLYRVSLAYSRNLQSRANVYYRQTRLKLQRPRLRTT
jgi:hypothetical protein